MLSHCARLADGRTLLDSLTARETDLVVREDHRRVFGGEVSASALDAYTVYAWSIFEITEFKD